MEWEWPYLLDLYIVILTMNRSTLGILFMLIFQVKIRHKGGNARFVRKGLMQFRLMNIFLISLHQILH